MMFLLMQVTEVKTKKTGTKRTAPEHRIPCAFPLAVCWRVFLLDFSLSNSFSGLLSLTGIEIYSSELRVDSTALVFSIYFSPKHFLYISDSWKGIDQTFPPQKKAHAFAPMHIFSKERQGFTLAGSAAFVNAGRNQRLAPDYSSPQEPQLWAGLQLPLPQPLAGLHCSDLDSSLAAASVHIT